MCKKRLEQTEKNWIGKCWIHAKARAEWAKMIDPDADANNAAQSVAAKKGAVVPEMDNRKGRRKISKLPYHPDCADAIACGTPVEVLHIPF